MAAYEAERLANIQRNARLLKELGIDQTRADTSNTPIHQSQSRSTRSSSRSNGQDLSVPVAPRPKAPSTRSTRGSAPTRRSSRLAAVNDYTPTRHSQPSPPLPPAPVLRQLKSPSISRRPEGEEDSFVAERTGPLPTRDGDGTIRFADTPSFTPNVTPAEMLAWGSFGGTAFKPFHSNVLKQQLSPTDVHELPATWYEGLPDTYLCAPLYEASVNRYGVKAGQSLEEWERAGWIHPQDPRGWYQWYCRFYLGRRTDDDERQISRWQGVCGPAGRFRKGLVKKLAREGKGWDDEQECKVLRQTLQHWAYRLTENDYKDYF